MQVEQPGRAHPPESSIPVPGHLLPCEFPGALVALTGDVASAPPLTALGSHWFCPAPLLSLSTPPPHAARRLQILEKLL